MFFAKRIKKESMQNQKRFKYCVFYVLSASATVTSCKQKTFSDRAKTAVARTENSPRFIVESFYNHRAVKLVLQRSEPFGHKNIPNDNDLYEYQQGVLDRKLDLLKKGPTIPDKGEAKTTISGTTAASIAGITSSEKKKLDTSQALAVSGLSGILEAIELQTGRYVTQKFDPARFKTACRNFYLQGLNGTLKQEFAPGLVESALQSVKGYITELSNVSSVTRPALNNDPPVPTQIDKKVSDLKELVEWLDEIMKFTLVQGPNNLLFVYKVNPLVFKKWKEALQTNANSHSERTSIDLTAVVFPHGRIAIAPQRPRSFSTKTASAWYVHSAQCQKVNMQTPLDAYNPCKKGAGLPWLADFRISLDPKTGIISNIGYAESNAQSNIKDRSDYILQAVLLAHGLAMHTDTGPLRIVKQIEPNDCNSIQAF